MAENKLPYKTYFDRYLKTKENSTCKICGKPTKWNSGTKQYCVYCSCTCRNLDQDWKNIRNNEMLNKYGTLTTHNFEKYSNTCATKTIEKYNDAYIDGYIINYDIKNNIISAHCNKCNSDFSCSRSIFYQRLFLHKIPVCTNCLKIRKSDGKSLQEQDILNFIKTFYTDTIIDHTRKILGERMELDFYFPDIHKAIEYDGTYHHADNRFYDPDDYISLKQCTAQELWDHDNKKNEMCKSKNIELLRIPEYDWETNTELIKTQIKAFLNK